MNERGEDGYSRAYLPRGKPNLISRGAGGQEEEQRTCPQSFHSRCMGVRIIFSEENMAIVFLVYFPSNYPNLLLLGPGT